MSSKRIKTIANGPNAEKISSRINLINIMKHIIRSSAAIGKRTPRLKVSRNSKRNKKIALLLISIAKMRSPTIKRP